MATGLRVASVPLGVEGKEFLLTPDGQSVMNIFTASGFAKQFCVRNLASTEDKKIRDMCRKQQLQ
jgi:hypothetical protein